MLLNINEDQFLENPSTQVVAEAIRLLELDAFAILAREEEDYIQTYHNDDGSYELQYRAGSFDKHFRAVDESLSTEDVARAFEAYFSGDPKWADAWEWEPVDFDEDFEGDLTFENAYELNGQEYEKIPVGQEKSPLTLSSGNCPDCGQATGAFHEPGCAHEECPCCHELICGCDCD